VTHIAAAVGLLCAGVCAAPVARADVLPCGLLTPCPAPPVTSPPPAPTSPPPSQPGRLTVTLDGHNGAGRGVEIQVQNGGVSRSDIAFFAGRCSDGGPYASEVGAKLSHPAAISSAGTAAYLLSYAKAHTYNKQGKRVEGHESMTVKLSNVSAGTATVRFRDTFRSGRYHCDSGTQTVTAYPLGSAKAPVQDSAARSGDYRTTETLRAGRRVRREGVRVSVYVPWEVMTDTRFSWVLECGSAASIETTELGPLLLHRANGLDTFKTSGHGVIRYKDGDHGDYTYSLVGQLLDDTTASLAWTYNEADYRGGRFLGSCNGETAPSAKL
jgi:hypothetical protein